MKTVEEVAVVVFEECASRTRTNKECADAIKLRVGINGDIEDVVRRYRQSGKGLEDAATFIFNLSPGGSGKSCCGSSCKGGCGTDYDTCLKVCQDKDMDNPELAASLCVALFNSGLEFNLESIEQVDPPDYVWDDEAGLLINGSCYFLKCAAALRQTAINTRAESIRYDAYEIAEDEVNNDMNCYDLLEYRGYDSMQVEEATYLSETDEILVKLCE